MIVYHNGSTPSIRVSVVTSTCEVVADSSALLGPITWPGNIIMKQNGAHFRGDTLGFISRLSWG